LNTGAQGHCISGINGPEKEPEYVSLTVPGQSSGSGSITGITPPNQNQVPSQRSGINWENLCEQAKSFNENFIQEDCDDLAHGTQLTREGVRVLLCLGGGVYLLLTDPLAFEAARRDARAAGL
jgi:hypothetical protein